jgi:hypothetical protein
MKKMNSTVIYDSQHAVELLRVCSLPQLVKRLILIYENVKNLIAE